MMIYNISAMVVYHEQIEADCEENALDEDVQVMQVNRVTVFRMVNYQKR